MYYYLISLQYTTIQKFGIFYFFQASKCSKMTGGMFILFKTSILNKCCLNVLYIKLLEEVFFLNSKYYNDFFATWTRLTINEVKHVSHVITRVHTSLMSFGNCVNLNVHLGRTDYVGNPCLK